MQPIIHYLPESRNPSVRLLKQYQNFWKQNRPLIELAVRYEVDPKDAKATESIIKLLLNKRAALRTARKWQLADSIRNDLKELGITLEDTSEGTISRYKKP